MAEVRYPMRLVAHRTGLSPHVLRVWERRYRAVNPDRSETNRRLYTEEEINRLELMANLTRGGHGIGQIANLPTSELKEMVAAMPVGASDASSSIPSETVSFEETLLEEAWHCTLEIDCSGLRNLLDKAAVTIGLSGLVGKLIVPLIDRIGAGWELGELSVAQEHAASAVIKEVLLIASRPFAESTGAPNMTVATPTGQLHELGAILVACTARRHGWDVTYLGPSLPAEEIVAAALRNKSLAVGLSIVYPGDDPKLPDELRRLRKLLPDEIRILAGGRAACSYQAATAEIKAKTIADLGGLSDELEKIRESRTGSIDNS